MNSIQKSRSLAAGLLAVMAQLLMPASPATAGQSTLRLISNQDNGRRLPDENIVYLASGQRTLQLQLEILSKRKYLRFPKTIVTVIDSEGHRREFKSDEDGRVTIEGMYPGLFGIAAFNDHAHGSTVFALRRQAADPGRSLFDEIMAGNLPVEEPATAKLVMTAAVGENLTPLVVGHLVDDDDVPAVAMDRRVVNEMVGLSPFNYRVQLGKGGVLRGQLITVMRPSSRYSAVKGTRVTVTKNGVPIAHVDANALGMFQIGGLRPGIHGLIVAGKGGYAAIGFEATDSESIAQEDQPAHRLASARVQFDGTILPIALIPPTMISTLLESVNDHFPEIEGVPSPTVTPDREPPALRMADNVEIQEIANDYQGGMFAAGGESTYNPLRYTGRGSSGSGSSGSTAVSSGEFPGLIGLGAAIAAPFAASSRGNRFIPGVPASESSQQ